jgi:hypothetical protein
MTRTLLGNERAQTVEVKYYNKFMYFFTIGAELTSTIGSSWCGWLNNKSPSLKDKCKQSLDRGFTRIELRFEGVRLQEAGYYEIELTKAMREFRVSGATRIQPIRDQWT